MSDRARDEGRIEPDSRLAHTSGIVLCTGFQDLAFGAHSLGERTAALLALVVHDVVWVGGGARPAAGAMGRAAEGAADRDLATASPEAALQVALEAADPAGSVIVVSADRPRLTPDLLIGLAGRPDAPAVVPRDSRGVHLLCARYDPTTMLSALAAGASDRMPAEWLENVDVQWFEGEGLSALDPDGVALGRTKGVADLERLVRESPGAGRGLWVGHPGIGLAEAIRPTSLGG